MEVKNASKNLDPLTKNSSAKKAISYKKLKLTTHLHQLQRHILQKEEEEENAWP